MSEYGYRVIYEHLAEGGFQVIVPALPGRDETRRLIFFLSTNPAFISGLLNNLLRDLTRHRIVM